MLINNRWRLLNRTLLEEARSLIKKYLAEHESLSTASLARDSGLPTARARSIIQGEVKETSKENITALLLTFMPFREVLDLIRKYARDEKLWAGILEIYAKRHDSKSVPDSSGFQWQDPDQEIVALAALGITKDRIVKLYGLEHGSDRLDALLNAGILREVNGTIRQHGDYVRYTLSDSLSKARLQAQTWQEKDMEAGGYLYHMTQCLSDEGHERYRDLSRQFIKDVTDLEKTYAGNDKVVLMSILSNSLKG